MATMLAQRVKSQGPVCALWLWMYRLQGQSQIIHAARGPVTAACMQMVPSSSRRRVFTLPEAMWASQKALDACRVVLVALLTAFLLVVQASNDYQCLHVAPGIDCLVHPGWALWCAYGAMFAWLALAILAIIGPLLALTYNTLAWPALALATEGPSFAPSCKRCHYLSAHAPLTASA